MSIAQKMAQARFRSAPPKTSPDSALPDQAAPELDSSVSFMIASA
jgi:hypothetical protein